MITKVILKLLGINAEKPHLIEYMSMISTGLIITFIGLYTSLWGFIAYGVATGTIYLCALIMSIRKDKGIPVFDLAWTLLTSLTTITLSIFYAKTNTFLSVVAVWLFVMTIRASYNQIKKMKR